MKEIAINSKSSPGRPQGSPLPVREDTSEDMDRSIVKETLAGKVWQRSRASYASVGSIGSFLSILSLFSFGSVLSIGSAWSLLSIGSTGSILSIGSVGSILSIGSAGSILSIGGLGVYPGKRS